MRSSPAIPYPDFVPCPIHLGYRGGRLGHPIFPDKKKRCPWCMEIWRRRNSIAVMDPDPEYTEVCRKLDEHLAKVNKVVWHKVVYGTVQQSPEVVYEK